MAGKSNFRKRMLVDNEKSDVVIDVAIIEYFCTPF
jgi:hypothetical protein